VLINQNLNHLSLNSSIKQGLSRRLWGVAVVVIVVVVVVVVGGGLAWVICIWWGRNFVDVIALDTTFMSLLILHSKVIKKFLTLLLLAFLKLNMCAELNNLLVNILS
jgi:hypothetical protein